MDTMNPKSIRNICLTGHSGSGKTSLAEAMLYLSKATERLGNIADGNTVSDFDEEEIKRGISISTSVLPITWLDKKINILDTPGYIDFNAEVSEAMRVADSMLIVVDGRAGVQVGTELQWKSCFTLPEFHVRFSSIGLTIMKHVSNVSLILCGSILVWLFVPC